MDRGLFAETLKHFKLLMKGGISEYRTAPVVHDSPQFVTGLLLKLLCEKIIAGFLEKGIYVI